MAANVGRYTSMDNGATAVSSASTASQLRDSGMAARSVVTFVVSVFAAPIVGYEYPSKAVTSTLESLDTRRPTHPHARPIPGDVCFTFRYEGLTSVRQNWRTAAKVYGSSSASCRSIAAASK